MGMIVEVKELSKSYGPVRAVDGISFSVEEGEIFGLLGPNGAGKTTAISMMTGTVTPDAGAVRICGFDLATSPQQAKGRFGLVPQELALYPTLSGTDNLRFFGGLYGLRGRHLRQRIGEALDTVGLTSRASERVANYSGGMKRRLNLAAGLLHHPQLLFLDEPTVGVDPQSRNHVFEAIQRLNREEGISVIYTSHYMEEVELLCRRAAIMDRGEIVGLGTVAELIDLLGEGVLHLGLKGLDEGLQREIEALDAVESVDLEGERLVVRINNSKKGLEAILAAVNRSSAELTELEILKPNLESVFLHLTGRTLRD